MSGLPCDPGVELPFRLRRVSALVSPVGAIAEPVVHRTFLSKEIFRLYPVHPGANTFPAFRFDIYAASGFAAWISFVTLTERVPRMVHIPWLFDDADPQGGLAPPGWHSCRARRVGRPQPPHEGCGGGARRMGAPPTPSESGVRPCGNHSGPIRDRVPSDESTVGRLVECPRSGNQEFEQLVDLLATETRSLNHGPTVLRTGPHGPNRAVEVREPHLSGGRPLSRRAGSAGSGWLGSRTGRTPEEPHRR